MKVRELIQDLLLVDQDWDVYVWDEMAMDYVIVNEWRAFAADDDEYGDGKSGIYFTAV